MELSLIHSILLTISLSGLASGLIAGLFGVGGGIILVPAIAFTLEYVGYNPLITMHLGVATSLAVIVPTSISSAIAHHRKGMVDYIIIYRLWPSIAIGAIIGAFSAQIFSGDTLRILFSIIAIITSINMMQKLQFVFGSEMPSSKIFNSASGSVIGLLSSMIGIGGGAISIPLMNFFSVPHHRTTGTASALGLVIAFPAAVVFALADTSNLNLPQWSLGMISLPVFFIFIPLTIIGAQIGAKLANMLNELFLRRIFSIFILLMAIRMIYEVINR